MTLSPEVLTDRVVRALNSGSLASLGDICSEAVLHRVNTIVLSYRQGVPHGHFVATGVDVQGDTTHIALSAHGKQTGPLFGTPPSMRDFTLRCTCQLSVAQGKVASMNLFFELDEVYEAIAQFLPAPGEISDEVRALASQAMDAWLEALRNAAPASFDGVCHPDVKLRLKIFDPGRRGGNSVGGIVTSARLFELIRSAFAGAAPSVDMPRDIVGQGHTVYYRGRLATAPTENAAGRRAELICQFILKGDKVAEHFAGVRMEKTDERR